MNRLEQAKRDHEITEKYYNGYTQKEIALIFGMHENTIWKILRKTKLHKPRIAIDHKEMATQYGNGHSKKELSKMYKITIEAISRILRSEGATKKNIDIQKEIAQKYKNGATREFLVKEYGLHKDTVLRILVRQGVITIKKGFTDEQKNEIIRLYTKEHRGKTYIGKMLGLSGTSIAYWLGKWGIPSIPRSIISTRIREIYGPTRGFTGHKHKRSSKEQISKTGKRTWAEGDREATNGKSRTYITIAGHVLGSYEVAYLQQRLEKGLPLPGVCHRKHKTPYGTYKPDFEFDTGQFIEIKSEFTLKVAKGEMPQTSGVFSDNQFRKIKYFQENIGPLDIVVMESKEAGHLFKRAGIKGGVLDLTLLSSSVK